MKLNVCLIYRQVICFGLLAIDKTQKGIKMHDLFGTEIKNKSLCSKFIIPPFSILNSRSGIWQNRKMMWRTLGIKGEKGRDAANSQEWAVFSIAPHKNTESAEKIAACGDQPTVFDPVLCELIYTWFCKSNGQIVDPFAGGSVRGIVASILGYKYWGCDLSHEQIDENIKQSKDICKKQPKYICGDSLKHLNDAPEADLIMSCPPYGNLEKYSDHPRDLSNMDYHAFVFAYKRIILKACKKLKNNSFACFVVGDFRDKNGFYRNFVSETINAFKEQKLELYNEAILVQMVGSGSLRANSYFEASRKMVKMHQNVLVFIKGDPKKATEEIKARRTNGQK